MHGLRERLRWHQVLGVPFLEVIPSSTLGIPVTVIAILELELSMARGTIGMWWDLNSRSLRLRWALVILMQAWIRSMEWEVWLKRVRVVRSMFVGWCECTYLRSGLIHSFSATWYLLKHFPNPTPPFFWSGFHSLHPHVVPLLLVIHPSGWWWILGIWRSHSLGSDNWNQ